MRFRPTAVLLAPLCLAWACVHFIPGDPIGERPAERHFKKAEALFADGKYAQAITEYRLIVSQYPEDDLADEALYGAAYAEIYFKNPKPDHSSAGRDFLNLTQKYPESPLKDRAQNWIATLDQLKSLQSESEKLRKDLRRLLELDVQSEKKRKEVR